MPQILSYIINSTNYGREDDIKIKNHTYREVGRENVDGEIYVSLDLWEGIRGRKYGELVVTIDFNKLTK